jgi:hypothetical protein
MLCAWAGGTMCAAAFAQSPSAIAAQKFSDIVSHFCSLRFAG